MLDRAISQYGEVLAEQAETVVSITFAAAVVGDASCIVLAGPRIAVGKTMVLANDIIDVTVKASVRERSPLVSHWIMNTYHARVH